MSKRSLKVSVTNLADFSCRVGNLELSGNIGPTAKEGMRAHQRIQQQRAQLLEARSQDAQPQVTHSNSDHPKIAQSEARLEAEYKLSAKVKVENVSVTLKGRVDLLAIDMNELGDLLSDQSGERISDSFLQSSNHRISEIKSTYVPADRVSESQLALQWAQIKLYGFMYCTECAEKGVALSDAGIELELIHANLRAQSETSDVQVFTTEELNQFAMDAITRYVLWQKLVWESQENTKRSALAMDFPFENFRTGQRDMAAAIFRTVRDGDTLLCEAPTGTGKTLSSVFPVIKAIGEGHVKHAVYLTAKTTGRQSAMQAVRALESSGLKMTSVMIRSKALTCFCSNGRCERDDKNTCPMTLGFFDRLPAAREEALAGSVLDGDALDEIAWQYQLCPFEFALQMLPWVTFVVADFNYVFDPLVRIARFSESRSDTALLIDEAHNLVDRARSMHSGHLHRQVLGAAYKLVESSHPVLAKRIKQLSSHLLSVSKQFEAEITVTDEVEKNLVKASSELVLAYTDAIDSGPAMPESLVDVFKMACRYIAISDLYSQHHRVLTKRTEGFRSIDVNVNLKCLDASSYLTPQYKIFKSAVVFSATLRPAPFYRDALGLKSDTQQQVLDSAFSPEQALHCVVGHINTRYSHREASMDNLVNTLKALLEGKPGNYMVFFPSYAYLEKAYDAFAKKFPGIVVWRQERESDADEREELLAALNQQGTRLGFAILGGVFGEGIDYIGDKLIGVAVVGVGLPAIGVEQDLIAQCYKEQGLDGFDYAYRYPGFTKVLQTAGRVIRSENDRGIVLLIDDRFNHAFYDQLYPAHWNTRKVNSLPDLTKMISTFWQVQDEFVLI